jgi:alpha-L-fucosidase
MNLYDLRSMQFRLTGCLIAVAALAQFAQLSAAQPVPSRAEEARRTTHPGGFGMGLPTTPEVVTAANAAVGKPVPPGPFEPTWDSIRKNYKVPSWFTEGKFGIFMHWGVYAVPAYHNEWYEKHMYGAFASWHEQHFGPQDRFGYKDFIPRFTCQKFHADDWAELFKKSGARYVVPTAQHHDNFAMWASDVAPINARDMGPKRDLIGELCVAVRKQGLKFGVSNHGMENFTFINPGAELKNRLAATKSDLFDTRWAEFYHVADRGDAACRRFLTDWVNRNIELIDKYQVDMLWFDNGVNSRVYDPLKLKVAAYYYNRARQWGKEVSISTKDSAYLAGSILDFEKVGRAPRKTLSEAWQVDDPIGSTWGYTSDMTVAGPGTVIRKLVDTVSKNGNLLLNLSPMADGTIPEDQQQTLLEVGDWLQVNGESIYGSHSWTAFAGDAESGKRLSVRFTVKGDCLYAILLGDWPNGEVVIPALAAGKPDAGKIVSIDLLGREGKQGFVQDNAGLKIQLTGRPPCKYAFALRIKSAELGQRPSLKPVGGVK